jgi:hypothetical protein
MYYIVPTTIGQKSKLLFGPSALGGESIRLKEKEMSLELQEDQLRKVIYQMHSILDFSKSISEKETEEIIRKIA